MAGGGRVGVQGGGWAPGLRTFPKEENWNSPNSRKGRRGEPWEATPRCVPSVNQQVLPRSLPGTEGQVGREGTALLDLTWLLSPACLALWWRRRALESDPTPPPAQHGLPLTSPEPVYLLICKWGHSAPERENQEVGLRGSLGEEELWPQVRCLRTAGASPGPLPLQAHLDQSHRWLVPQRCVPSVKWAEPGPLPHSLLFSRPQEGVPTRP